MKTIRQLGRRIPGRPGITVAAVAGAILLLVWIGRSCGGNEVESESTIFRVETAPLTIDVVEGGTIKAREQIILKNQVEGQTTILYVIPEGSVVTTGTLLVELDSSSLQDHKINQEIQVENAEAAFISAQENVEVVKNQALSNVEAAELNARFAEIDLKKYLEGDSQRDLLELNAKITLAEQQLEQAREELEWSRILHGEGYLAEGQLQNDELAFNKAELDLKLARENLRVMTEYDAEKTLATLKSDIRQTEMALERARRKASADVVQAEANLRAKQSEFERQKDRLEKVIDQIEKTRIYAPADGLVVYATSARGGWRGNDEPLAEGRGVREREDLIYLPTASEYMAEVRIHESSLNTIFVGASASIRVDALPGQEFQGTVTKIAPLPDAQSMFWNPDLKVYPTEVYLDGESPDLRTGMNCQVKIIVAHYPEALAVPIQTVLRVDGQPTVYVREGRHFEPREVTIGMDNNRMVHILSGLEAGEEVMMAPPLQDAEVEEPSDDPEDLSGEENPDGREGRPDAARGGNGNRGGPDAARGRPGNQRGAE